MLTIVEWGKDERNPEACLKKQCQASRSRNAREPCKSWATYEIGPYYLCDQHAGKLAMRLLIERKDVNYRKV